MRSFFFTLFLASSLLAQPYEPTFLLDMIGDTNDGLGTVLEAIGDQDADGYDDLLVSVRAFNPSHGAFIRLIYGGPTAPYRTLEFAHLPDTVSIPYRYYRWYNRNFDRSLSQDYNGDGHIDLMLSLTDYETRLAPRLYLFLGGPSLFDTLPDWISDTLGYGFAVSSGDYDANGFPDWIMENQRGSQYTLRYFSNAWPSLPSTPTWTLSRYNLGGNFSQCGGVGDVTGDGWPDFFFHNTTDSARNQIWFGGPAADSLPDWSRVDIPWWDPTLPLAALWEIIGDINGDGTDDLIAETFEDPENPIIRVWHGGLPLELRQWSATINRTSWAMTALQNRTIGDINGDGYEDLAFWERFIGEPGEPHRVVVYLGGNPMDGQVDLLIGPDFGGFTINNVYSRAGDFNGDGLDDWMFGSYDARTEGGQDRGRVTIIAGDTAFGVNAETRPEVVAQEFRFGDPYPNPFNSSVTIPLTVDGAHPKLVDVAIYNLLGQTVFAFGTTLFMPGENTLLWNGQASSGAVCTSGTYLVRATAGNQVVTTRMQLIK